MLKIITAEQRLSKKPKVNIAIFGQSGVGKTTQARTLDPATTLFIDFEAGTLALGDWPGDVMDVRRNANELNWHPWDIARGIACLISGPDPSDMKGPYSQGAYSLYAQRLAPPEQFARYKTIFIDSITVAGRMSYAWAEIQAASLTKSGVPDTRAAYGTHGKEMTRWLTVLQHSPKNIIVVGILNKEKDEFNRVQWVPQIEGQKTGLELPGIFDQIATLQNFETPDKQPYKAFVNHQQNPWEYPAKDRSDCLELIEEANLGKLIEKIEAGKRLNNINYQIPVYVPTPNPTQTAN